MFLMLQLLQLLMLKLFMDKLIDKQYYFSFLALSETDDEDVTKIRFHVFFYFFLFFFNFFFF